MNSLQTAPGNEILGTMTDVEAAKLLGISHKQVRLRRTKLGIQASRVYIPHKTDHRRAWIHAWFVERDVIATTEEFAAAFEITIRTAWDWLNDAKAHGLVKLFERHHLRAETIWVTP